jgi:hypothetical protein
VSEDGAGARDPSTRGDGPLRLPSPSDIMPETGIMPRAKPTYTAVRDMHIPPIYYPGDWLDIDDRDVAFELQGMLDLLADCVAQAAIALTMFEDSTKNLLKNLDGAWQHDAEIRAQVEQQLCAEVGQDTYYRNFAMFRLKAQQLALKRMGALGVFPRAYAHKIPLLYAHSFLYAVDSFRKFLHAICGQDSLPNTVGQIERVA